MLWAALAAGTTKSSEVDRNRTDVEETKNGDKLILRSPTEREIANYQAIWRRDWLARIGEFNLSDEWRKRYEELVSEFGEPEHPEIPSV